MKINGAVTLVICVALGHAWSALFFDTARAEDQTGETVAEVLTIPLRPVSSSRPAKINDASFIGYFPAEDRKKIATLIGRVQFGEKTITRIESWGGSGFAIAAKVDIPQYRFFCTKTPNYEWQIVRWVGINE